jgi:hypothetical protein
MKKLSLLIFSLFFAICGFANLGINTINTSTYLSELYFDNTNGLYGWQEFSGSYSNTNTISGWIGNNNLTVYSPNGNLNATNDHLGRSNALSLNGTDQFLYDTSSDFNNTNESISCGGWFRFDPTGLGSDQALISKWEQTAGDYRSFALFYNSPTNLQFSLSEDGSVAGVTNPLTLDLEDAGLNDNKFHHIQFMYNQSDKSVMLQVDNTVRDYKVNSNLSVRFNDANSSLAFGAIDVENTPQWFFKGDMADVYCKVNDGLTANEGRKVGVAGAQRQAYIDGQGTVQIPGKKKVVLTVDSQKDLPYSTSFNFLNMYIPENNLYNIIVNTTQVADLTGSATRWTSQLNFSNSEISSTLCSSNGGAGTRYDNNYVTSGFVSCHRKNIFLKKNSYTDFNSYLRAQPPESPVDQDVIYDVSIESVD